MHNATRQINWELHLRAERWEDLAALCQLWRAEQGLFVYSTRAPVTGLELTLCLILPDGAKLTFLCSVTRTIETTHALVSATGESPAGFNLKLVDHSSVDLTLLESMITANAGSPPGAAPGQIVPIRAELLVRETMRQRVEVGPFLANHPVPAPIVDSAAIPRSHTGSLELDILVTAPQPPTGEVELSQAPSPMLQKPSASTGRSVLPASTTRARAFGIDFGTSYSSIALVCGTLALPLADEQGRTNFPSVVHFPRSGKARVGWEAREMLGHEPYRTLQSPKRLIGRHFGDQRLASQLATSEVPLERGPNDQIVVRIDDAPIALPQICAEIFRHLVAVGEAHSGQRVEQVVLAAPVAFDAERVAIGRAAQLAGLEVLTILDEPVAAAVGFGAARRGRGKIAVYDFGGGTFDFTVLEVENYRFRVLAEAGDAWLGGDDFDLALASAAANLIWQRHQLQLQQRQVEWQRLLLLAEQVKRQLGTADEAKLVAKAIAHLPRGPVDLTINVSADYYGSLCRELIERSIETIDTGLSLAGLRAEELDEVVLTGGMVRLPMVRERVESYFRRAIPLTVDPELAVSLGTAQLARELGGAA
jgi:actin-like ATPase involved in cell morphogenesis